MFKTVNPYDEVVAKATAETATDENWDIFVAVWDKVNEDGEAGARNCVAALQRRLQHRNANVQLFALTLADGLVSNCGAPLHREICGKAFTQTLVKLVNDRTTHEGVKKRVLKLISSWVKVYGKDPNFDLMVEVHDSLKKQNFKFEDEEPSSPVGPSDEIRRREEEDLQRALAESAALASSSSSSALKGFTKSQPSSGGKALPQQPLETPFVPPTSSSVIDVAGGGGGGRVRALFDFETSSADELSFLKGDVINVLERNWKEWWTGELRGRRGMFPIVYVEEIHEPPTPQLPPQQYQEDRRPTSASGGGPMNESEMEAQLFAQSASIDKLLNMMRSLDPTSQNLAQNEELLDLYQQSMALRPKVVKLIEKYNKKQEDLRLINDKFTRASSTYDRMVLESQMRHNTASNPYPNGGYDYSQPQQTVDGRPDPRALAGLTEQQRREYEGQWAAYEQQLAMYNAQQAAYFAHQQELAHYQQQGQGGPLHVQQNGPPPTAAAAGIPQGIATLDHPYHDPAYQAYQQQLQQQQGVPVQGPQVSQPYQRPPIQDPSQSLPPPSQGVDPQHAQAPPTNDQQPQSQPQAYWDEARGWVFAQPQPQTQPQPQQDSQHPLPLPPPQSATSPPPQTAYASPTLSSAPIYTSAPPAQLASPPPPTGVYQGYQLTDQLQNLSIAPTTTSSPTPATQARFASPPPPASNGVGFDPRIAGHTSPPPAAAYQQPPFQQPVNTQQPPYQQPVSNQQQAYQYFSSPPPTTQQQPVYYENMAGDPEGMAEYQRNLAAQNQVPQTTVAR